jgi:hypothetical protein
MTNLTLSPAVGPGRFGDDLVPSLFREASRWQCAGIAAQSCVLSEATEGERQVSTLAPPETY